MKRVVFTFLLLVTSFGLLSCTNRKLPNSTNVSFYYIHTEMEHGTQTPLLAKVAQSISANDSSYDAILRLYLNGPTSYDCVSPFPGGTELVEIYVDSNRANIVLTPHIGTLSPARQIVACACLAKTVLELTGVDSVQIRLENSLINGVEIATFDRNSFAFFDSITQADVSQ